ncbi:hypothetical protein HPB50_002699 [Hyalomma asiaticum]|uniref:Uncharacterized protein n=1 Tax=Hyalomma asiaticum TaxID=266040 RepID=A0ACB7TB16_HYAAI|nr:hypothetical protein HPB50_002699 [Hyalomma asiaticum]
MRASIRRCGRRYGAVATMAAAALSNVIVSRGISASGANAHCFSLNGTLISQAKAVASLDKGNAHEEPFAEPLRGTLAVGSSRTTALATSAATGFVKQQATLSGGVIRYTPFAFWPVIPESHFPGEFTYTPEAFPHACALTSSACRRSPSVDAAPQTRLDRFSCVELPQPKRHSKLSAPMSP